MICNIIIIVFEHTALSSDLAQPVSVYWACSLDSNQTSNTLTQQHTDESKGIVKDKYYTNIHLVLP